MQTQSKSKLGLVNCSSVFRFACSFAYMTDSASPGWPQTHYEVENNIDIIVFLYLGMMTFCGSEDPTPSFFHAI